MKNLFKFLLIFGLYSSLCANTILYGNYEFGSKPNKNLVKATASNVKMLPIKENNHLKYYKDKKGLLLLFRDNHLVSVDKVIPNIKSSLREVTQESQKELKNPLFLGGNILKMNKREGLQSKQNFPNQNKFLEKYKMESRFLEPGYFLIGTEAFFNKNENRKKIIIYLKELKKAKDNCPKCDIIEQKNGSFLPKNILVEMYIK